MSRKISKSSFEFAKILSLVSNAKIRSQVLKQEKEVVGSAKYFIQQSIINRLAAIESDIKNLFGDHPEDLDILKQEMLDVDVTLQFENIQNLFLALPKKVRDEIESYIEQRHFVYANKVA